MTVTTRTKALMMLLLALPCIPALAQTENLTDMGNIVIRAETHLVPLSVTVVDAGHHLVTNLPQSAFQVYENNVLQPIKVFKREDVEISLGLIIDNSGSMREKRAQVATAALDLVKDSNPGDEVFIVNFNDQPVLDMDFTSDQAKMSQALSKIDSHGGTAMRDAIDTAMVHLREKARKEKKVLLVVTDGNDNASVMKLEPLVKAAQNSGVLVYAIGLLAEELPAEAGKAKKALDTLTESTGGEAFYPTDLQAVDQIAHHVAHDLRNQYSIAYSPTNDKLDGTYRQIKVVVTHPTDLVARTRSGYYAPASAQSSR
jgi:Ca-activated chloride channel family protein